MEELIRAASHKEVREMYKGVVEDAWNFARIHGDIEDTVRIFDLMVRMGWRRDPHLGNHSGSWGM